MRLKVNLIILNFNGRDLLEKYLQAFTVAARESRHECVVTVLDNASADSSVEYVREHFPQVRLVVAPLNKVLCSYNDLAREVDDDVLMLLNNDIGLHPTSLFRRRHHKERTRETTATTEGRGERTTAKQGNLEGISLAALPSR